MLRKLNAYVVITSYLGATVSIPVTLGGRLLRKEKVVCCVEKLLKTLFRIVERQLGDRTPVHNQSKNLLYFIGLSSKSLWFTPNSSKAVEAHLDDQVCRPHLIWLVSVTSCGEKAELQLNEYHSISRCRRNCKPKKKNPHGSFQI